jgi:hypothetical protein
MEEALVLGEVSLMVDLGLILWEFVTLGIWLDGRNILMNLSLLRIRWEEIDWLSSLCSALGWPSWVAR